MSSPHNDEPFTSDLQEVAEMLNDRRPTLDPLALDRVKLRAMSAARRPSFTKDRRFSMRSRLTTLLAAAFLALGTGGALALSGGGGSGGKGGGSASFSQYRCEHSKHGGHCEEKEEHKEEHKEEKGKGKKH